MKTKIIATIGPSSYKKTQLKKMDKNGMDIVRLNTKHINKKEFKKIYSSIKKLKKIEILIDINNINKLKWINNYKYEYLAVSFASNKTQIKNIKKQIKNKVKIISKIENKKGLKNFNDILKVSDGIMVARGDLAKNISYEKVPSVQKRLIKECNKKKKFSITATEMLLSIMYKKSPEKSEVSDIANAVLEGSNALMLSEETAIGKHPALAVKIMNKIIKETEKNSKNAIKNIK